VAALFRTGAVAAGPPLAFDPRLWRPALRGGFQPSFE
jgi:hypothetical protein